MSNFRAMTRAKNEAIANGVDKRLKDWQPATWLDNYFGKNKHGIRFDGDGVVRADNGDFEYSKLIRPGHNVELPRCWADSNTPNTPQTAATVLSDDELREKVERLVGTAILKNDKNYTNDFMALFTQQRQAYADARVREALKSIPFTDRELGCMDCYAVGIVKSHLATLTQAKETEK